MSKLNLDDYRDYMGEATIFTDYIGLELKVAEPGHSEVEVELKRHHQNPQGMAHGGLVFTLCDMAAGIATIVTENGWRNVVTSSCSMNYFRPSKGTRLKAVGTLIKAGKTICVAEATAYDDEGRMVAKGTFSENYIDDRHRREQAAEDERAKEEK